MNTRSTRQEPTTPYSEPERFIHRTKKKKKRRNPFIPVENRIPKVNYPPFKNLFEALVIYNLFLDLPFPMADDQPMWGNNRAVAPTPGAGIVAIDLGDIFTVKGHHLSMIKDRKFDGRARADPHKHIAEFIEICGMFQYGNTNADAVKLKLFPSSLAGDPKVWFNELSLGVIATWEQMRQAFVSRFFPPTMFDRLMGKIRGFTQHPNESLVDAWLRMKDLLRSCYGHGLGRGTIIEIFYHGLDETTQAILDAGGIFLYKIPNEAHQLLEDRVLLKLDWSKDMKAKPIRKTVAFTESINDSKLMEKMEALTTKIDSQFKDIKGEIPTNDKPYRPPFARNEHVNVVFTRSGLTYDSPVNPNVKTTVINDDSDDEVDKAEKEIEPSSSKQTKSDSPPLKAY
ncbi:reverse transcriptase domain-containing protein [Tanacetum coccineum]